MTDKLLKLKQVNEERVMRLENVKHLKEIEAEEKKERLIQTLTESE